MRIQLSSRIRNFELSEVGLALDLPEDNYCVSSVVCINVLYGYFSLSTDKYVCHIKR